MCLARPKSETLIVKGNRRATSRFSGFRSRWTTPSLCIYYRFLNTRRAEKKAGTYGESIAGLIRDCLSLMLNYEGGINRRLEKMYTILLTQNAHFVQIRSEAAVLY